MNKIIEKILENKDNEQIEVILSEEKRIIVEAPAGYGKTQTMTSKIAYLLATGKIPNPKKILALTFSVNATQKIREDILEDLSKFDNKFTANYLNKRITATNYHGFARQIIRHHGHIYNKNLKEIDLFMIVEDKDEETLSYYKEELNLSEKDIRFIDKFNDAVNKIEIDFKNIEKYKKLLLEKFIPKKHITYNGLLVLAFFILKENKNLLEFYSKLYPFIIIDEFQDTNILSFYLILPFLKKKELSFLVLGDPLQQIYGFIGSIPDIFNKLEKHFNFKKIELKNNYRFKGKDYLLKIDKTIREYAKNPANPQINSDVNLKLYIAKNQEEEANEIIKIADTLQSEDKNAKIAILFRNGKNQNTSKILEFFNNKQFDYFYALFTDEDKDYRKFNEIALNIFSNEFEKNNISKRNWNNFKEKLKEHKEIKKLKNKNLINSLLDLIDIFYDKDIKSQKKYLPNNEIIFNIKTVFLERQLKQYLKYIDKNIIVLTVHGAKGLEWDYVIIPDMEKGSFPAKKGLCQFCKKNNSWLSCSLEYYSQEKTFKEKFFQEISTFYVACTRAKKDLYFTLSNYNGYEKSTKESCFLKLNGFTKFN